MRSLPLPLTLAGAAAPAGPVATQTGTGLFPAGSTTFRLVLIVHIAAGLTCVAAGAVAAASRKRPSRHPQAGTAYYWSLLMVFATAATLAVLGVGPRTPTCWHWARTRSPRRPWAAWPNAGGASGTPRAAGRAAKFSA